MKALVTGAKGTLGKVLCRELSLHGYEVHAYDRNRAHPLDVKSVESYFRAVGPQVLFHLAIATELSGAENEAYRINVEWPAQMAALCRETDSAMVYTSSVMVYEGLPGPFTPEIKPRCEGGWGYHKFLAEEKLEDFPQTVRVVRPGWQIAGDTMGNQMSAQLAREATEKGIINANINWLPACSFVDDTARGLIRASKLPARVYLLDSNQKWNMAQIARALKIKLGTNWNIRESEGETFDQRMIDPRLEIPALSQKLPDLARF